MKWILKICVSIAVKYIFPGCCFYNRSVINYFNLKFKNWVDFGNVQRSQKENFRDLPGSAAGEWNKWAELTYCQMGLDAIEPVFGGLRTTQAQTSLRIRAV